MRTLNPTIFAACLVLAGAACADRSPLAPASRGPGVGPGVKPAHAVVASSSDIDLLSVELRGGDLRSPLLYDIPLREGGSDAPLAIPQGKGYQLLVRGYDRYGQVTHEGTAALDYVEVGVNEPFDVELAPLQRDVNYAKVHFDLRGEGRSADVQISVRPSARSVPQGETLSFEAQVLDARGQPIDLQPGDLHWAVSDPRAGRLLLNSESQTLAALMANQSGNYSITVVYKDRNYLWNFIIKINPYVQISAGFDFTCGIRLTGALYCWGFNWHNELGVVNAPNPCQGTTCSDVPLRITNRLFSSVATGWVHACAIEAGTGDTYCWGDNFYGELGLGTKGNLLPPTVIPAGPKFQQLSASLNHTCGIASGTAYCWGSNDFGQLGLGSYGNSGGVPEKLSPTPVPTYSGWNQITAGESFNCGVIAGVVRCWGMYNEGEIGNGFGGGTTSSPVNVSTTFGSATVVSLAAGSITTSMCAIVSTGAAWCWGDNQGEKLGVLGLGSLGVASVPAPVSGGHVFQTIASGSYHTCGVDDAYQVFCWGDERDGRIGLPAAAATTPTPQKVTVATETFSNVVAGNSHTCALTSDGHVYCWGSNARAQLGNGAINNGSNVPSLVWGT